MIKKIVILFVLLFIISCLYAEQDTTVVVDTLTAEQICFARGHTVMIYHIYRENVMPEFFDYPDSTVLIWYDDNIQTGILNYCIRCNQWIGLPILNEPNRKVVWKNNAK